MTAIGPDNSTRPTALVLAFALTLAWLAPGLAEAELAPEELGVSERMGSPEPHWTYYLDFQLSNFMGRYVLMNADNADFLAYVSTGQMPTLATSPDGSEIYVTETTYEYGSRGERHDFVTLYDTTDYAVKGHIDLPTGKRAMMASLSRSTLLNDPRFLAIYNYTPATSVSIVDLKEQRHVVEIPAPGCHLVYPTGARGVSMLCGDGTLLTLHFDESGALQSQHRSAGFFDPKTDHLKTNAAHIGDTWYFISYAGDVYPVDLSGERPRFEKPWALVDHDKKPAGMLRALFTMGKAGPWLPGGMKLAAAHAGRGELYVIVHPIFWSEGKGDHDFPGPEVWVFDIERKQRIRRLKMHGVAMSIGLTQDESPLLLAFTVDIRSETPHFEIYDAQSGEFLREMFEYGSAVLSFEPVPQARAQAAEETP
jgi:methylamine dehydrogenase heavy chain